MQALTLKSRFASAKGYLPLAAAFAFATAANAATEIYPASDAAASKNSAGPNLELSLDGQSVPLAPREVFHSDSKGQDRMEILFARFATDGRVNLRLTSHQAALGQPVLRTIRKDLPLECPDKQTVAFDLPGPGQYYLQLPSLARSNATCTVVLWVDDLQKLKKERTRFQAAGNRETGLRPNPDLDQTQTLQAALDKGGIVVLGPGVYRSGSLKFRSNTTLYLSPGAVLRALDGEQAVGPEFIAIENAAAVKICGPGTVDANSFAPRRQHNVHNVNVTSSRDITFEDVLFENSNSWAVHIRKSDRFTARNVRVLSGKDGFDPDASREVTIEGAFIISGDDGVAVKNRFPADSDGKITRGVTVRNSIVSTFKSALKIGTETRGPVRDITFENCDVFDSDRGIVLYANDGGPVEHAVWRNVRLFMKAWPREKESGSVFHLVITQREAATPVRDCLIENIDANWVFRSELAGLADAPLNGVTLRNIRATVESPKGNRPALFVCRDNVDVPLKNLAVNWQGNQPKWDGIVSGKGLAVTGLTESGNAKGRD
jgi:hypothetical protein